MLTGFVVFVTVGLRSDTIQLTMLVFELRAAGNFGWVVIRDIVPRFSQRNLALLKGDCVLQRFTKNVEILSSRG